MKLRQKEPKGNLINRKLLFVGKVLGTESAEWLTVSFKNAIVRLHISDISKQSKLRRKEKVRR